MRCPQCHSINFVRAHLFWWEVPLFFCLTRPFRCDGCLNRMYGFVWVRSRPRSAVGKKKNGAKKSVAGTDAAQNKSSAVIIPAAAPLNVVVPVSTAPQPVPVSK